MEPRLIAAEEAAGAEWLLERLERPMGWREPPAGRRARATYVGTIVPTGFPAYARILHPARRGPGGTRVRWAEVAEANGRIAYAEMQWEAITAGGEGRSFSAFDPPEPGRLPPEETRVLVELLRRFTARPEAVEFAVWDGWGRPVPLLGTAAGPERRGTAAAPAGPVSGGVARLHCPDAQRPMRSYLLCRGPLEAAIWLSEQANNASLWWPRDRSWCVATEVDFAWTYVAGCEALVEAILADGRLEAYRTAPDHRADAGADRRNASE